MPQPKRKAVAPLDIYPEAVQKRVYPEWFDFKNPDNARVFRERLDRLDAIRKEPEQIPVLKAFYKDNPAEFINDWGVTFDPRLVERGLPGIVPFVLFDRQRDYIDWIMGLWRAGKPGLDEKSRDCGVSWLNIALSCTMCLHHDGMTAGFGSRKEEYVDKIGNMKALFPKARMFMENVPWEFRGGWLAERDAPYMRIIFPETQATMVGEAGSDIGRGDRTSIYFFDEAAHHPQQDLVEAALSQTTNCRIDVSSVKGMNNQFAKKRHAGKISVFVFDHRSDPRKGPGWYAKQVEELDEVTVAQEIDRDYLASNTGMVIPGKWARACVGALQDLGIAPTGDRQVALDVADEGKDLNALCGARGVNVEHIDKWSGKGEDIFKTTERAFAFCDEHEYRLLRYDADGLGAGVRGDARIINERRVKDGLRRIEIEAYRGSEAVHDPEGLVYPDQKDRTGARRNKDFFANRKAQMWWQMRMRIQRTYRWVVEKVPCDIDDILSFDPKCPHVTDLINELSQPTYSINGAGKVVIDKTPDGMPSPNLADSLVIRFAVGKPMLVVSSQALKTILQGGRHGQARRTR